MNLRPGIDTDPPAELMFVKLNFMHDDGPRAVTALKAIERVRTEMICDERMQGEGPDGRPLSVVRDHKLNLLVGFGLRFFLGELSLRPHEDEVVPNFPPGGVFTPRQPTRFGIERIVPVYLRTMNALGDIDWVERLIEAEGGNTSDGNVKARYQSWLADAESDLLLYIESNERYLNQELWERIRAEATEPNGLKLASPVQQSQSRRDGRDHIGWKDPISNMQDLIRDQPQYYRSKIYLPHPAPAFPGERTTLRDDPAYDGGTYMVHRKYAEDLDKWRSDQFTITDDRGRVFAGEEARQRAVGRDRATGKIIHKGSGKLLEPEKDATEVHLGFTSAHVLMARGATPAPFHGDFQPLTTGEVALFDIQDIRIRRRGSNFSEPDRETGKMTYGLHFVCFQNNIQQTGFEFINNVWLMNPKFRGAQDHLLDLDKGIGRPVEGSYYFIPPEHRAYAGECFFE